MKRIVCAAAAVFASASALATSVGVSVSAGEPGFYGRVDIGYVAQPPRVIYARPVVVEPMSVGVTQPPIYLHVPPGHAKNWRKHCYRYHACGQPVYFVQESWYNDVYVPHYRGRGRTPVALAAPAPAYRDDPPRERFYEVPVTSVHAVIGAPEQRCWVERQQIVEPSGGPNVPGAIVGAVVGGVLGHQVGSGRGRDVATAGGAVAGAAIGANVGRGGGQFYNRDVERCETVARNARPEYWEVTYRFRGVMHRVQMTAPPGRTLLVDANGLPRV